MNYYNEHDPKAAAWLRELINAGLIPTGDVDERSIVDLQPDELRGYTQCHFFAGIGGWSLALQLAGWPADRPVWTGSCPCQPFSSAGKGLGDKDERHLWPVFFNLIRECRPDAVFGEQVASAIGKGWLDGIQADLESEDYACGSVVLGAHSVGSPHIRQRLYWVADSELRRRERVEVEQCTRIFKTMDGEEESQLAVSAHSASSDGLGNSVMSGCETRNSVAIGDESRSKQSQDSGSWSNPIGLADSGSAGHQGRERDRTTGAEGTPGGHTPKCHSDTIGLGDSVEQGLQGQYGSAEMELHRGEGSERSTRPTGFWDRYDIIPCRDGKSRRIECQSRGLADGIFSLLDSVRDAGATEEQIEAAINPFPLVKKQLGRAILLKGYGNAIVPQVAAEFVKAFVESQTACSASNAK